MTQSSDGKPDPASQETGDLSDRRDRLERELQRRSGQKAAEAAGSGRPRYDGSALAMAMRVGSEFIAAVIVGAVIGWGVDRLFGSAPWGMITFLMLGFAAGVVNVMRTTGQLKKPGE